MLSKTHNPSLRDKTRLRYSPQNIQLALCTTVKVTKDNTSQRNSSRPGDANETPWLNVIQRPGEDPRMKKGIRERPVKSE